MCGYTSKDAASVFLPLLLPFNLTFDGDAPPYTVYYDWNVMPRAGIALSMDGNRPLVPSCFHDGFH